MNACTSARHVACSAVSVKSTMGPPVLPRTAGSYTSPSGK
jgi:hypothetical protein